MSSLPLKSRPPPKGSLSQLRTPLCCVRDSVFQTVMHRITRSTCCRLLCPTTPCAGGVLAVARPRSRATNLAETAHAGTQSPCATTACVACTNSVRRYFVAALLILPRIVPQSTLASPRSPARRRFLPEPSHREHGA